MPQVRSLTLAADSGAGDTDADPAQWGFDDESDEEKEEEGGPEQSRQLGSLVDIPNLAGLEVSRSVRLPPNWRALTQLRRLSVKCSSEVAWGSESAAGLTRLTAIWLHNGALKGRCRFPRALCTLPALRQATVGALLVTWIAQGDDLQLPPTFTRLTSLTRVALRFTKLEPKSAALVQQKMPQLEVVKTRWSDNDSDSGSSREEEDEAGAE